MINQAQWINGWYYKATLTYPQFIQLREYERSFRYSIDEQTKNLIANETDLAEAQISTLREQNTILAEINATVSTKLDEINGTLNWGFTEVIIGIGRVNDHLADLVKIARTPAQTWAYEQYDIAHDAYRKGLYSESLRYLDRAINGAAGNAGYDLDFRFHFLKGLICLGSYKNADPAIVSLPAAEASFLLAARYSQTDYPQDAARSLLLAGRAAYCNRQLDQACQHTDNCISLAPQPIAEAHFQRAKIMCALTQRPNAEAKVISNAVKAAAEDVMIAVRLDRVYGLRIASDGDLAPHESLIMGRIEEELPRLKDVLHTEERAIIARMTRCQNATVSGFSYANTDREGIDGITTVLRKAQQMVANATYFSLLDACSAFQEVRKLFVASWKKHQEVVLAAIRAKRNEIEKQTGSDSSLNNKTLNLSMALGVIVPDLALLLFLGNKAWGFIIVFSIPFWLIGFLLGLFVVWPIVLRGVHREVAENVALEQDIQKQFAGMGL